MTRVATFLTYRISGHLGGRGFEAPSRDAEGVEGVGNGEGVPLLSRLEGLGERRELPQWDFSALQASQNACR